MDKKELMKEELQILFYTICDGLRQEVRQRKLSQLVSEQDVSTKQDFSLTCEREIGIASSLALHLRSVGFATQLDAYFPGGSARRRPDFGIYLPASKNYIYLELKQTAWGRDSQYYYQGAIHDIEKLHEDKDPLNQQNGLVALGFSNPDEKPDQLVKGFEKLSKDIINNYPYEKIGLECIDLQDMDKHISYAMVGLWFHKYQITNTVSHR